MHNLCIRVICRFFICIRGGFLDTRMGVLPVIILAALFLIIGFLVAPKYIYDSSADKKELFVVGTAEEKVVPNNVVVNINITNEEKTASAALEANQKQFDIIKSYVDSLKDYNGIKLETGYFSVNPKYEWDKNLEKSIQVGYDATHSLRFNIEDFNSKWKLLVNSVSEFVKNRSVSISSLSFEVSDALKDKTKKSLVGKAMKDAWEKAKGVADAGFFVLESVPKSVNLSYSDYQHYPVYYDKYLTMTESSVAGAANNNITPEEVNLSVSVDTTYTYN